MNRKFERILDECLTQLQAGASVEACLARYPDYAEQLRPFLNLAAEVQAVPLPSPRPAAVRANRQRMLAAVREKEARQPLAVLLWGRLAPSLGRAALIAATLFLVLGLGLGGLAATASDSLPGDSLYPVKRFVEKVHLALTVDPLARHQLQIEFAQERRDEIWAVLETGRQAAVEFRGLLSEVGDGYWIVGGLRVNLDAETVIVGHPVVGAIVVVDAWSPGDGTLVARRLEVQSAALPTPTPSVTPSSTPTASATHTHTPTPTPTASATPTPSPTSTPEPTSSPTDTSEPSDTPEPAPPPSDTPAPSATHEPEATHTPQPAETDEPESTDEPHATETDEPEPTDKPHATETDEPEPTDEPEATHTPQPTATYGPEPTHTPHPTATYEPEPTHTPYPTETEEPESTDEPHATETDEPEATHTPHPTRRP